ncbi:MAG: Mrp/NBP35 family ATP-binding protein [Synergistales bacterium]|nr:Mrp/NBP35 family ATP-binding protein [Synergistales bacterium]
MADSQKSCGGANTPFNPTKGSFSHTIAVGSGKGGVGKSSVAALTAVALARAGKKVAVLDADVTGPSIPKLLGVTGTPEGDEQGIIPPATKGLGIKVMSVNLLMEDPTKPVVWRGPLIGNLIRQFWTDVNWDDSEYLVVDLPPGTADAPLTVMQTIRLDGLVMVTSPQELAGLVVEKAVNMARMMNVPLLGVVENMSYATCPHCGETWDLFGRSRLDEVARSWGIPALARIPIDSQISGLGDDGRLEVYANPQVLDPLSEGITRGIAHPVA